MRLPLSLCFEEQGTRQVFASQNELSEPTWLTLVHLSNIKLAFKNETFQFILES